MKTKCYFFLLFFTLLGYGCSQGNNMNGVPGNGDTSTTPPSDNPSEYSWEEQRDTLLEDNDMLLLYAGGAHRKYTWDENAVKTSVTYLDEANKEHWLFDSFLFLEIYDSVNGIEYTQGYGYAPSTQNDWKRLVDTYFQPFYCLGALDRSIEAAKKRIGEPPYKRRVIIGIPEPVASEKTSSGTKTSSWGSLHDGRNLDFTKEADRIEAVKWYIDYVRESFNRLGYKNLELAGFYWIAEQDGNTKTIIPEISKYLNGLKYTFNWIPYYNAQGADKWKGLGFNFAYLQPNYFFADDITQVTNRLESACSFANQYNLNLEMEFDNRVLSSSPDYRANRLENYMQVFKEQGVWKNKRIAYYQGDHAVNDLATSVDPNDHALYVKLCKFVSERPVYNK